MCKISKIKSSSVGSPSRSNKLNLSSFPAWDVATRCCLVHPLLKASHSRVLSPAEVKLTTMPLSERQKCVHMHELLFYPSLIFTDVRHIVQEPKFQSVLKDKGLVDFVSMQNQSTSPILILSFSALLSW